MAEHDIPEAPATHRHWLAPDQPCLPQAANWLIESDLVRTGTAASALGDRVCDLRDVVCVTPGNRSNRLLLQCVLDACETQDKRALPPRFITPGEMVDVLFAEATTAPRAMSTELLHAWMAALRRVDRETLEPLLPRASEFDDALARYDLARTLARLHDELAGERITFSHVAQTTEAMERFAEADRWRAMHAVHGQFEAVLQDIGLCDPPTARRAALDSAGPPDTHLVLIGVVDLNAQQRVAVQAMGDRAHVLVHADAAQADLFDACGCVDAAAWRDRHIAINDAQVVIADRPPDQAQAVLRKLAAFDGRYATDAITVGLGSESLADHIALAAQWVDITMHDAAGEAMSRTRPFRLLSALADWLRDASFAHFATLLRHPDVERWLEEKLHSALGDSTETIENWITLLDAYFSEHLQGRLTGRWLGDEQYTRPLAAVWDAVQRLCAPFDDKSRALGEWASAILQVLQSVYAHARDDQREATRLAEALRTIRETLSAWHDMPQPLQPHVDATTALRLALRELTGRRLPSPVRRDQIEMLGWLELHLDTAPALIITGFNDGDIPSAVHGDAFLPNSLRERLGLINNTRRHARDAYLLQSMLESRDEVTLITGRRRGDDEPATPSRLLFACDDETLLKRVRRVCGDETHAPPTPMIGWPQPGTSQQFDVPPLPHDMQPPAAMYVTDFKLYMQCPYRYALQRLLGLEPVDDAATELDPLAFGRLAHKVLEQFGCDSSIRASDDAEAIEQYLFQALDALARDRFGTNPLTSVRVQLDVLEQRLHGFAHWQAQWRRKGWAIQQCEWKINGAPLDIPGEAPMPLRGKIDRVDVHEESGAVRIIDYKTGESPHSPNKVHFGRENAPDEDAIEWQDLQLPLYHHLYQLEHAGRNGSIQTGYVVLPRDVEQAGFLEAQWKQAHIEHGIETARDIVRCIRAGQFELNHEFDSSFDRFARICRTTTFAAPADAGDETEEAD